MTHDEIMAAFHELTDGVQMQIIEKVTSRLGELLIERGPDAMRDTIHSAMMAELEAQVCQLIGPAANRAALELCEQAASGDRYAWPRGMEHRFERGTPMGWRVNRVAELAQSVKRGTFRGRETVANPGSYQEGVL